MTYPLYAQVIITLSLRNVFYRFIVQHLPHSFIKLLMDAGCSAMGSEIFFANFVTFFRFALLTDFLGYRFFVSGKLIVSQVLDNFPLCVGFNGSVLCSQQPASG
jgi:hypothetical protein